MIEGVKPRIIEVGREMLKTTRVGDVQKDERIKSLLTHIKDEFNSKCVQFRLTWASTTEQHGLKGLEEKVNPLFGVYKGNIP